MNGAAISRSSNKETGTFSKGVGFSYKTRLSDLQNK